MDVLDMKIITIAATIILTLVFGSLPYFLIMRGSQSLVNSAARRERILSCLNSFAGGVFLGILLFNIMTEGMEAFEEYKTLVNFSSEFPFFSLFTGVGFFLVCFSELVMHKTLHGVFGSNGHEDSRAQESRKIVKQTHNQGQNPEITHLCDNGEEQRNSYGAVTTSFTESKKHLGLHFHVEKEQNSLMANRDDEAFNNEASEVSYETMDERDQATTSLLNPGGVPEVETVNQPNSNVVDRTFLLLAALSVHTIFDGMVVGLQEKSSQVWAMFGGITLHKVIIAFCLGLEIFKHFASRPGRAFFWMFLFSLMSPIGIFLGIILTSEYVDEEAKLLSSSILQGVAAGMFLYVTFLEILSVYIGKHSKNTALFVMLAFLGFSFVGVAKVVELSSE